MEILTMISYILYRIVYVLFVICICKQTTIAQDEPTSVSGVYCKERYMCSSACTTTVDDRCSCHPACELFGDCCYNSYPCHQNNSDFISTIRGYEMYFQCTNDVIANEWYWMVSRCPESWTGTNKCDVIDDDDIVVGRLDDHLSSIPVVSPNGVTFRNIYCAVCHGNDPDSLTPWSFQAKQCDFKNSFPQTSNLTITDKIIQLKNICQEVSFLPPVDHRYYSLSVIPCRNVNDDVIDTCNEYVTDSAVIHNCSTIAAPLYIGGKYFKNQVCLNCYYYSTETTVNIIELCLGQGSRRVSTAATTGKCVIDPKTQISKCPTPLNPNLVPISITFDFGNHGGGISITTENDNIEQTSVPCDVGQVFDPFIAKCVFLSCPRGYVLIGNNCMEKQSIHWKNNTMSCDLIALNLTVELVNSDIAHDPCDFSKNITHCLPDIYSSLLKPNFGLNSCSSENNIFTLLFNVTTSTILLHLLSPVKGESPSDLPASCSGYGVIELSAVCILEPPVVHTNCGPHWLNSTQWYVNEESEQIFLKDSGDSHVADFIELRVRHRVSLDDTKISSETIQLQTCEITSSEGALCPFIMLDASLFEPDANDPDVQVYVHNTSIRFAPDEYILYDNGSIHVCNFFQETGEIVYVFFPSYSPLETILSTIGISLSILALTFSFVTYCIFSALRNRIGNILIMTLCAFLIIAQSLLIFAGVATTSPVWCAIVSGIGHFCWLASFSTSSLLGFALVQTFSLRNQTTRGEKPSNKTVVLYLACCIICPIIISTIMLVLYLTNGDRFDITYGTASGCWIGGPKVNLFAFGMPVAVSLLVNLLFFSHVTSSICRQTRSSQRIRKSNDGIRWREFLIYIKVFVVLGLTWVIGFVASFTNLQFLWYIFIILTSLQGVLIFLAFTFNSQIWGMWRKQLGLGTRRYTAVSTGGTDTSMTDKYRPRLSQHTEISTV